MNPTPPSAQSRLPEALHHVLYEIRMLLNCFDYLGDGNHRDTFLRDICLESFIIHARALDDFFTPLRYQDDIRACHFLSQAEQKSRGSRHPDINRMHKEIVHLSYSRKVDQEKRLWVLHTVLTKQYEEGLSLLLSCEYFLSKMQDEHLLRFKENRINVSRLLDRCWKLLNSPKSNFPSSVCTDDQGELQSSDPI